MITLTFYRDEPEQEPIEVGSISYDGIETTFTGQGERIATGLPVRTPGPDSKRLMLTDAPAYWLRHAAARYSNGYGYATLSDDASIPSEAVA